MDKKKAKEAVKALKALLSEHPSAAAVGIGKDGVEVRLYRSELRDLFPDHVDGVPVNVIEMKPPRKRLLP